MPPGTSKGGGGGMVPPVPPHMPLSYMCVGSKKRMVAQATLKTLHCFNAIFSFGIYIIILKLGRLH